MKTTSIINLNKSSLNKISLNGTWIMSGADKDNQTVCVPVTIPCTVHTALAELGMLKDCKNPNGHTDLFYADNADKTAWIEDREWCFEREFDFKLTDDVKKLEIEFKGLDTYCKIYINDRIIGNCKNMHMVHTFDILGYIKNGTNKISVKFLPPVAEDRKNIQRDYNGAFSRERFYTRRMQCTYGWDWINRFVTMGIFADVDIYINRFVKIDCLQARLDGITPAGAVMELYIKGSHDKRFFDGAFRDRRYHFETSPMVCFTVNDPDGNKIYQTEMLFREEVTCDYLTIENPRLWYPTGYGESPLYTLTAQVKGDKGNIITEKTVSFGIREISIVETFDKEGTEVYKTADKMFNRLMKKKAEDNEYASFDLYINGIRIICKGGNWVPPNPFPGNAADKQYEALVRVAKEGNINMLRVWGGGVYEKDKFYELCDKYGIMVQQDFCLACGNYPYSSDFIEDPTEEEAEFIENLAAEFDQNVQRLVSHPSIVWWNGNNENETAGNPNLINNARRIAAEVSAPVLRKYDGKRHFFRSTPWGGSYNNSPSRGLFHATGFLGEYFDLIKYTDMEGYVEKFGGLLSRFANETPILSCPAESSVKRFLPEAERSTDSFDGYIYHTKNHPDDKYKDFGLFHFMDMGAKKLFGNFKDGSDRIYKMGILGYEWARATMEGMRRREDYTSGVVFWMYNDCWPALGWSIVDYYGTPKAAYYAMKRTSAAVCSSITCRDGKLAVNISNDATIEKEVKVTLSLVTDGEVEYKEEYTKVLKPQSLMVLTPYDNEKFTLNSGDTKSVAVCDVVGSESADRSFYTAVVPSKLQLPAANVKVSGNGCGELCVKSDKLAMFVWIDGDYVFSDNCMLLMPGEEKTITATESFEHISDDIKVHWING